MKSYVKPIGYIEKIGRCIIKKVQNYGMKYRVSEGQVAWHFADIHKARIHAMKRTYGSDIVPSK